MGDDILVNWLKLTLVKGLGPSRLLKLISYFGSPKGIFSASNSELLRSRVFNETMLVDWDKLRNASDDSFVDAIRICQENNIAIVPLFEDSYPKNLKNIPSPPKTLFMQGDLDLLNKKKIAIVGTRHPEKKALEWAESASKAISDAGYVVVSGGALGIDTVAHFAALKKGKTICVFGTGLLHYYPEENRDLFAKIKNDGLIISEHLPSFRGNELAFKLRNRITSGISNAIIVVATKESGGSMTQARIAYEQRIPIFCPKLSLNLYPNEGIAHIIKSFGANEISSWDEVLDQIGE